MGGIRRTRDFLRSGLQLLTEIASDAAIGFGRPRFRRNAIYWLRYGWYFAIATLVMLLGAFWEGAGRFWGTPWGARRMHSALLPIMKSRTFPRTCPACGSEEWKMRLTLRDDTCSKCGGLVERIPLPAACPHCASKDFIPILYGLLSPHARGLVWRGWAVPGGCLYCAESKQWRCRTCGLDW